MRRLVVFGRTNAAVAAGSGGGFARFAGAFVSALPKHRFFVLGIIFYGANFEAG